jgi:hypothetical protein
VLEEFTTLSVVAENVLAAECIKPSDMFEEAAVLFADFAHRSQP